MNEHEQDLLQWAILEHETDVGASSFQMGGNYEIHPRPECSDFSQAVHAVILGMGFKRAVDVRRGPFYYRRLS